MNQNMDKIKEIIIQIEALKTEQKFEQCKELLEKSILEYTKDYRLYEELADVYLYR
jgi:IS1 family transposase